MLSEIGWTACELPDAVKVDAVAASLKQVPKETQCRIFKILHDALIKRGRSGSDEGCDLEHEASFFENEASFFEPKPAKIPRLDFDPKNVPTGGSIMGILDDVWGNADGDEDGRVENLNVEVECEGENLESVSKSLKNVNSEHTNLEHKNSEKNNLKIESSEDENMDDDTMSEQAPDSPLNTKSFSKPEQSDTITLTDINDSIPKQTSLDLNNWAETTNARNTPDQITFIPTIPNQQTPDQTTPDQSHPDLLVHLNEPNNSILTKKIIDHSMNIMADPKTSPNELYEQTRKLTLGLISRFPLVTKYSKSTTANAPSTPHIESRFLNYLVTETNKRALNERLVELLRNVVQFGDKCDENKQDLVKWLVILVYYFYRVSGVSKKGVSKSMVVLLDGNCLMKNMLAIWKASKNLSVHNVIGKYGCQTLARCVEMNWCSRVFDSHLNLVVQLLTYHLVPYAIDTSPDLKTRNYMDRAEWLLRVLTEGLMSASGYSSIASGYSSRVYKHYGYVYPICKILAKPENRYFESRFSTQFPNFYNEVRRFQEQHDTIWCQDDCFKKIGKIATLKKTDNA